jgi:flavin reductase (DIM6/NTAB) family NADH-FMN oxidoreductase RutF
MLLMPEIMDNVHRYFATTVGLITTNGSKGRNVMAAEWTIHVSYEPMLIAVFVHESPTYQNIQETQAFGVNIASDKQAELVNIAGGYSGTEVDKLGIPGTFETYDGKNVDVPMIKGCALSAECKVVSIEKVGDHIMVVGEAVSATFDEKKFPLIYTRGNYRKLSKAKIPSGREVVKVTADQMSHFKEMSAGQFVLKAAAAVVSKNNKTLLQKSGNGWNLPMVAVPKGTGYKEALEKQLSTVGSAAAVWGIRGIARLTLKSGRSELRANFIMFDCNVETLEVNTAMWFSKVPKTALLQALLKKS